MPFANMDVPLVDPDNEQLRAKVNAIYLRYIECKIYFK